MTTADLLSTYDQMLGSLDGWLAMTAYAILRAAGVPLGKIDYVGCIARAMRQPAD